MPTTEAILDDCRRMADAVAGDLLSDRPLYLATDQPRVGDCLGWTTPERVPAPIRQQLVEAGTWQGPGVFIALDIAALRQEGGEIIQAARRLLVHELAHNYPVRPLPRDIEPSVVRVAMESDLIRAWTQAPENNEVGRPWDDANDHSKFHARRCIHLHYRAVQAGFPFDIRGCFESWFYTQHAPEHFADILRGEVRRMAGCTMAEVETLPFEPEFERRFQSEIAFYESFQKPRSKR